MDHEFQAKDSDFKTLIEWIGLALKGLDIPCEFRTFDSFITDGKKSAAFIQTVLNDEAFKIPNENDKLYEIAEMRARHSAVTFLLGLVFKQFGNLFDSIPTIIDDYSSKNALKMWLITSLYHDCAYSSTYILRETLNLKNIFAPYLLADEDKYQDQQLACLHNYSHRFPNTLAHTYETILNYYNYSFYYHNKDTSKEKSDHGVLGGTIMFSKLAQKAQKQKNIADLTIIKACSLAVAQHNIFKAEKESDTIYPKYGLTTLLSTSSFKIQKEHALLLFLSLVDTIECVKKFSKSQNKEEYLQTLTVLGCIKAAVCDKEITLDLSDLDKEITEKRNQKNRSILERALKDYRNSLNSLNKWTTFSAKSAPGNINRITISLIQSNNSNQRVLAAAGAAQ